jgi:ubiquitin-protein ligase E3 C
MTILTICSCPTPSRENILFLLPLIIQSDVQIVSSVASKYYEALSSVLNDASFAARNRSLILNAIRAPLTEDVGNNPNHATLLSAHLGFALEFLTTANLTDKIGGLQELAQFVHISTLGQALLQESSISVLSVMDADSRLWLLAHYIALHNLGQLHDQNTNYVKALSILLSYSANDIYGRVDSSESHDYQDSPDDDANSETSLPPLPQFIREQLTSLVNRRSITELLDKFNT